MDLSSFESLSVELSFNSEEHSNYDILFSIILGLIISLIVYITSYKRIVIEEP